MYMLLLSFLILSSFINATNSYGKNNYQIIIVGAGPSGIAAATRLLENQIYNITVLEAEGRYGGRINTRKIDGRIVELGAEWCHGKEDNIVFEMANEYNLLKHKEYPIDVLYSNGEHLEPAFTEEIFNLTFSVLELEPTEEESKLSQGEFFLKHYEEILDKYKDDEKKLKFAVDAISTIEALDLTDNGAFSWLEYPIESHWTISKGYQDLVWNGVGYDTILEIMMQLYQRDSDILGILNRIHLNKRVEMIEYKKDDHPNVIIKCQDETYYSADHVIFTPSLGVLKKEHEKIFQPALDERKKEAIDKLGFEGVMKIICHFERKWWAGSFTVRPLVWTAEDKVNLRYKFPNAPIYEEESWVTRVAVIHDAENDPNALVSWVTGPIIEELEDASETVIEEGMMFIYNRFFGNTYNISKPTILRTRWYNNENFRGTYSFETMRSHETDDSWNQILSEPIFNHAGTPIVLFAGEATHPTHYATVHGAIETGYREAKTLLGVINPSFNSYGHK